MSKTLQQIRADTRVLISETDENNTHVTNDELNGFINQAQTFVATVCHVPRDHEEITAQAGVPAYPLLSDTMFLLKAYYGNPAVSGDLKELPIYTEERLCAIRPGWMSTATADRGIPDCLMLLDKHTVLLSPTPNATSADGNRKLFLSKVYYPQNMTSDSDTPDVPPAYDDLLSVYAAHLCYASKLNNPEIANSLLKTFYNKSDQIKQNATQEHNLLSFPFVANENPSSDWNGGSGLREYPSV